MNETPKQTTRRQMDKDKKTANKSTYFSGWITADEIEYFGINVCQ